MRTRWPETSKNLFFICGRGGGGGGFRHYFRTENVYAKVGLLVSFHEQTFLERHKSSEEYLMAQIKR